MKKRFQVVAIAAAAVILLSLVGYWILSGPASSDTDDITFPTIDGAESIYTSAVDSMNTTDGMVLNILKTTRISIGSDTFEEVCEQTLSYTDLGTEQMRAYAEESTSMGKHSFTVTEAFSAGKGYVTVNGSKFVGDISAQDFAARFAPAVCLDPALYATITGVDTGGCYLISFEKPSHGELWALQEGASFILAAGTARISYEGTLLSSTYDITYTQGNTTVTTSYTVTPSAQEVQLQIPTDISEYSVVSYLDAPKMLEKATGYLMQTQNISASYTENIYFQAFGDQRVQNITLHTGTGTDWSAMVATNRTLTNTSREGEVSKSSETQLFTDGRYQSNKDGGAFTTDKSIRAEDMQNYCFDRLLSTVMLPQYITRAYVTVGSSTLTMRFTGSQEFAKLISTNACQILYQKPEMLKELAQSSSTDLLSCYVELDKNTGLPLSSGIDYKGTFVINALPYQLGFKADQAYTISSKEAMEEISKAAGA